MDAQIPLTESQLNATRLRRRYQDVEDGIYAELHRIVAAVGRGRPEGAIGRGPLSPRARGRRAAS